ncbi:MAG TPA: hypothetical protein VGH87_09355 [Polyangiaceae bacterium]|jgi:hypothetical protein
MFRLLTLVFALVAQPLDAGARVAVVFELRTPGADVHLVNGADVRALTTFPIRIAFDASQTWAITATKPGYCPLRRAVDFTKPTFVIELKSGCNARS